MWVEKWQIISQSSGNLYIVSRDEHGQFGCSCPHWKFRRQQCKHIQKIKGELEMQYGKKPLVATEYFLN